MPTIDAKPIYLHQAKILPPHADRRGYSVIHVFVSPGRSSAFADVGDPVAVFANAGFRGLDELALSAIYGRWPMLSRGGSNVGCAQTDNLRAAGLTLVASSTRTDVGEALTLAIRGRLLVRTDGRNLSCSRDSMLALHLGYPASVLLHSMAVIEPSSASCQTAATSCRSSEIVATIASNSVSRSGWCFRKYCCTGLFSRSFAK
jgi:hypothetical protein